MKPKLLLRVDPLLTYSLNTQVKEQLKWLIGTEKIIPGELLPPATQLAEQLNLNRNTINLVYTQLRDEGIVSIQKGTGTRVLNNATVEQLIKTRLSMVKLWVSLAKEVNELHLDLEAFATAGIAFTQMLSDNPLHSATLLFIECQEHDYVFYQNEINRLTGLQVNTFYLEDVPHHEDQFNHLLLKSSAVVTTLNHADEVNSLVGSRKQVITIGATIDFSVLMAISQLKPDSKIGFVCLGLKGGQWMVQQTKNAGIHHIETIPLGLHSADQLLNQIETIDTVYASLAVYDEIKQLAPDKVIRYPMILEKSSENLLINTKKSLST